MARAHKHLMITLPAIDMDSFLFVNIQNLEGFTLPCPSLFPRKLRSLMRTLTVEKVF